MSDYSNNMVNGDSYIRTFLGRRFDFDNHRHYNLNIEEIAHSLSQQCRWTGHTKKFYSVAQHCVLCAQNVSKEFEFEALMHDASEAFIGDVSSPLKKKLPDYKKISEPIERFICDYYLLPFPHSPEIKVIDNILMETEGRQLINGWKADENIQPLDMTIKPWSSEWAKAEFLYIAYKYIPQGK